MKKIILFITAAMTMGGCDHSHNAVISNTGTDWFGKQFDLAVATTPVAAVSGMVSGTDTMRTVLEGEIVKTCPGEGCWFTMKNDQGEPLRISTDHIFFVPTEGCEGKKAKVAVKGFIDNEKPDDPKVKFIAEGVMIEGLVDTDMQEHDHSKCDHDHSHDGEHKH
ncbi:MAG: DUF4920 domain-containing protein [Flavobacteriales bacterium]